METAPPATVERRGLAPARGGGLHTLLFFGLIVTAVTAAGFIGIAMWGPEKPIVNRNHFATDPPPVLAMGEPSAEPAAKESPAASATASAAPEASASAEPPTPPAKKAKRTVAAPKSKRH